MVPLQPLQMKIKEEINEFQIPVNWVHFSNLFMLRNLTIVSRVVCVLYFGSKNENGSVQ